MNCQPQKVISKSADFPNKELGRALLCVTVQRNQMKNEKSRLTSGN